MNKKYERKDGPRDKEKDMKKANPMREWQACQAYNKPDGCPESRSHWARIGNRDQFVQHICAVCLLKDGQKLNHPEGHQDCKHVGAQ